MKPVRITHAIWAGLQTGSVTAVYHNQASLRRVGDQFLMIRGKEQHTLSIKETDSDRLNAHWIGFAR